MDQDKKLINDEFVYYGSDVVDSLPTFDVGDTIRLNNEPTQYLVLVLGAHDASSLGPTDVAVLQPIYS